MIDTMEDIHGILRRTLVQPCDGRPGYDITIERHDDFTFIAIDWTKAYNAPRSAETLGPVGSVRFITRRVGQLAVITDSDYEPLVNGFALACREAGREQSVVRDFQPVKLKRRVPVGGVGSTPGELNRHAKLTEADVREIRRLAGPERRPLREIAEQYGVYYTTIWKIVKRLKWRHVD